MRIFLGMILSVLVLFAQSFTITNSWQLLGSTSDINSSVFDGSCADYIWSYDDGWKLHVANYKSYQLPDNISKTSVLKKGEGFWVKGTDCQPNSGGFTADMLAGKTIHQVYIDHLVGDTQHFIYGYVKKRFDDDFSHIYMSDYYDSWTNENNVTVINGKINKIVYYTSYGLDAGRVEYSLSSVTNDYIELNYTMYTLDGEKYSEGPQRYYFDINKAFEYIKTLETYDDNFFNSNLADAPKAIVYYDPTTTIEPFIKAKFRFKDYGITQNSYSIEDDGITLKATNISGNDSNMKASFRRDTLFSDGVATIVHTYSLDDNHRQRVYIKMNGYNNGSTDVSAGIVIFKNKAVYTLWENNIPYENQTYPNFFTIVDNQDFQNKDVKMAIWKKDGKIYFYVESDGNYWIKEFDIDSNYLNNKLQHGFWKYISSRAKDGATQPTEAKILKAYLLR